jgi:hypothetical protein
MENAPHRMDGILSINIRDYEIFTPYVSFDTAAHAVNTQGERHRFFYLLTI